MRSRLLQVGLSPNFSYKNVSPVTDANVDLLLQFAIRKSDLVVLDKCETFLMLKSRKSISELLKIAMEFSLEALKVMKASAQFTQKK